MNRPFSAAVIAALFWGAFVLVSLGRHHRDPSYFVCAGVQFCNPKQVPASLRTIRGKLATEKGNEIGFDGQFYYRLALNPFTDRPTEYGITLDSPAYRQQRIGYPFLAWLLSAGKADYVVWALVAINLIGLVALAWLGAVLAQDSGNHALWGLAFSVYAGFVVSLKCDLTEILEMALLLGSLCCYGRKKVLWSALLLTGAVMTRETALLVAVGAFLFSLYQSRRGQKSDLWRIGIAPILAYVVWQTALTILWRDNPVTATTGINFTLPLLGIARVFHPMSYVLGTVRYWSQALFLLALLVYVASRLAESTAPPYIKIAWTLYAAMTLCEGDAIWKTGLTFMRVSSEFCLLGFVLLLNTRRSPRFAFLATSMLLCLFEYLVYIRAPR